MKTTIFIFAISIFLNSCTIIEDSRPPTVLGRKTTTKPITNTGPPYTMPSCNYSNNTTYSMLLNFRLVFTGIPKGTLANGKLTFKSTNSNNDRVEIVLSPFEPGQSTVYDIVGSPTGLSGYKAYIEFNADKMNPTTKVQLKSTPNYSRTLHLKYLPTSKQYEMVFCDVEMDYYFNGTLSQEYMDGKFTFAE